MGQSRMGIRYFCRHYQPKSQQGNVRRGGAGIVFVRYGARMRLRNGTFERGDRKKCSSLVATDFSFGMLKRAEKKYKNCGIRFERADILHLDFPDENFDAVVAANVIHLLDEPYRALREPDRVCRRGGKIVVPTYMNCTKKGKINGITCVIGKAGVDFKREFTPQTYGKFFTDAGYTNVRFTFCEGKIPCSVAVAEKSEACGLHTEKRKNGKNYDSVLTNSKDKYITTVLCIAGRENMAKQVEGVAERIIDAAKRVGRLEAVNLQKRKQKRRRENKNVFAAFFFQFWVLLPDC